MTALREVGLWNLTIDGKTGLPTCNTPERHLINNGFLFQYDHVVDVTEAGNADILFKTPDTTAWVHVTWDLQTESEAHFYMYENPTTTDDGTLVTAFNKNRNSTTTDTLLIYHTPGGVVTTDTGVLEISDTYTMAGVRIGQDNFGEWVLEQNQDYLFRVTSATTDNNHVSMRFIWAEVTDAEDLN